MQDELSVDNIHVVYCSIWASNDEIHVGVTPQSRICELNDLRFQIRLKPHRTTAIRENCNRTRYENRETGTG